ncbi:hypothetical protein [Vreelandella lutescens]|uniref:Uncharacterized protein n=1 Tax=Vreelandella lutescens TaxID=1602943 RepID=A0ABQ1NRR3_9GAMM|nr:hypothetical protein [Halomonas lutescens]GGC83851.1 hypothetical protein GCM10011382_12510 [Halomonas lutescens]
MHRKKIGEDFARHIESMLKLQKRWLDKEDQQELPNEVRGTYDTANISSASSMSGISHEIAWAQAVAWTEVCDIEPNLGWLSSTPIKRQPKQICAEGGR